MIYLTQVTEWQEIGSFSLRIEKLSRKKEGIIQEKDNVLALSADTRMKLMEQCT